MNCGRSTSQPSSILAIIPARGGSKGLPGKNLYPINGRPLIDFSIEAALKCRLFGRVVVSSDDEKILEHARIQGAVALKRPAELATDSAQSEMVIRHALEAEADLGFNYQYFVLLQPTSPLRSSQHIVEAIGEMKEKHGNSLISVVPYGTKPFKCFVKNGEGYLKGLVGDRFPFTRRQDLATTFLANGAIYLADTELFLKTNSLFQSPCVPYLMTANDSVDIDSLEDIELVETILNSNSQHTGPSGEPVGT